MPGGSHGRRIPAGIGLGTHVRPERGPVRHRLLELTLGYWPLWRIAGGRFMSDDRAVLRKKMQDELVELKSSAIAELEQRGYEVRGKTTSQIRQILKRHPTKSPSVE